MDARSWIPLGSEFIKDDLELIGLAFPHGIVLPKAESGADVTEHPLPKDPVHAIATETAASLFGLFSYRDPAAMSWGAEDLSAALGRRRVAILDGGLSFTYRLARARRALPAPSRRAFSRSKGRSPISRTRKG